MFLAGVVLAPLAQFDDLGAGQRLLGFERVGRQFDLRAVGAELGDDPGMPGFAGHRELEIIDARQASAAIGILDETDVVATGLGAASIRELAGSTSPNSQEN